MEINVMNTTWDLMLKTAYSDNICDAIGNPRDTDWSARFVKATDTDGVVNDPNGNGKLCVKTLCLAFI